MEKIKDILAKFDPIHLDEMDRVKLMNRVDEKYILNRNELEGILKDAAAYYYTLEIKNKRLLGYRTLYFDTPDKKMYTAHQNGKKNRYKIRKREYIIDDQSFLEIKFKSNKGKTEKKRIKNSILDSKFTNKETDFINTVASMKSEDLVPSLKNRFSRITLVHKTDKERVTIDLELGFENPDGETRDIPFLCIIEVKREKISIKSDIIKILKAKQIRPMRISKYCIGSILLDKNLKHNRFKPKLLKINKLNNE